MNTTSNYIAMTPQAVQAAWRQLKQREIDLGFVQVDEFDGYALVDIEGKRKKMILGEVERLMRIAIFDAVMLDMAYGKYLDELPCDCGEVVDASDVAYAADTLASTAKRLCRAAERVADMFDDLVES